MQRPLYGEYLSSQVRCKSREGEKQWIELTD